MSSRRKFFIWAVILLIAAGIFFGYRYLSSTQTVNVSYKNVSQIEIKQILEDGSEADIVSASSAGTGQKDVRLKKWQNYIIYYKGMDGYSDGQKDFRTTYDTQKVTVEPYFSEVHLANLLTSEVEQIRQKIKSSYPDIIISYKINSGALYHFGDWYGTKLQFIGNSQYQSDDLKIVLQKSDGEWKIASNPPYINLDKFTYPNIPVDILRSVNKM